MPKLPVTTPLNGAIAPLVAIAAPLAAIVAPLAAPLVAPIVAETITGAVEPEAMTEIAAGGGGLAPILVPTAALEATRRTRVRARRRAGIVQPAYDVPMPRVTAPTRRVRR